MSVYPTIEEEIQRRHESMGSADDVVTPFDDPGAPAPVPPPAEPLVAPDADEQDDPGAPAPVPPPNGD